MSAKEPNFASTKQASPATTLEVLVAPIPDVDQTSPLQTFELRLELPKPAVATKLG
ncbi:hypothetical protein [Mesorhizobium sp.]|uniref:hypothetical protein n=1 Tax=Mesorhizobium sp. TaxID=1871066 RepID=UPI00257BF6CF|nr:hypothetical protein [Mesorhizobium sp.]